MPQTEDSKQNILARGSYYSRDGMLARPSIKPKKNYPLWVYVTARFTMIILAAGFIVWGSSLALDGSWDLATFLFITGILFFIPFILYSRKVNEIKKSNFR